MKLRKEKEQIPADFRKQMYENYKANMTLYGKPILPYKQWLKMVRMRHSLPGRYKDRKQEF